MLIICCRNDEHVDLINQLVAINVEKEEVENELVRYKMLYVDKLRLPLRPTDTRLRYAELAHSQQESMSTHRHRLSQH